MAPPTQNCGRDAGWHRPNGVDTTFEGVAVAQPSALQLSASLYHGVCELCKVVAVVGNWSLSSAVNGRGRWREGRLGRRRQLVVEAPASSPGSLGFGIELLDCVKRRFGEILELPG